MKRGYTLRTLILCTPIFAIFMSARRLEAYNDVAVEWTLTEAAYNPSLVQYGDQYISALKHTTFRRVRRKVFWVNHLHICAGPTIDLQGLRCQGYNPWREPYPECEFGPHVRDGRTDVTGLGDVKVWVWRGRGVYTIFGRKPERKPGQGPFCEGKVVYDQWIAQVRPEQGAGEWHLQQPLRLYMSGGFKYPEDAAYIMEKNWMPWVYRHPNGTELLYMTHMVNPHRVLEVSPSGACEVRHETAGRPDLFSRFTGHSIHGGPPVVYVDSSLSKDGRPYYLGIMHHIEFLQAGNRRPEAAATAVAGSKRKSGGRKMKLYRHFAYKFQAEPPFAVTDISDELNLTFFRHPNHLTKAHIAYVAGFYLADSGKLYVSYGAGDREARVMTMLLEEMEALFTGKVQFLPTGTVAT